MSNVNVVAEGGPGIAKGRGAIMSLAQVSGKEVLALLGYYCPPAAVAATHEHNQPIVGLVTPTQCRRQKIEPLDESVERALFRGLPRYDLGSGRDEHATATGAEAAAEGHWGRAGEFLVAAAASNGSAASILIEKIDRGRPLHTYGVDSPLAVELQNWFGKLFKADVAIFDITGQVSLERIAEGATAQSELLREAGKEGTKTKEQEDLGVKDMRA